MNKSVDQLLVEIENLTLQKEKLENRVIDLEGRTGLVWKDQPEHFIKTLSDGDVIYGNSRFKLVGKKNKSRGKKVTATLSSDHIKTHGNIEMARLSSSYLYKAKGKIPDSIKNNDFLIHGSNVYIKVEDDFSTYIPKLVKKPEHFGFYDKNNEKSNILIEGDNYHALQILQHTHKGKVDVIYIDPPYNTGKDDFKYNDNFVDSDSTTKNSSWLSFMERRLVLAKNLLKETGCILVSIDKHQNARLELLLDKVFGENNKIQSFSKETAGGTNNSKHFSDRHEYLHLYGVSNDYYINPLTEEKEEKHQIFSKWGGISDILDRPNRGFPIYVNKKTGELRLSDIDPICTVKDDEQATLQKLKAMRELEDEFYQSIGVDDYIQIYPKYRKKGEEGIKDGYWRWQKNGLEGKLGQLICKQSKVFGDYIYEVIEGGKREINRSSLIPAFGQGGAELTKILNDNTLFSYPKALDFVKYLLTFFGKDAVALDFFAGSGTTGHAVWDLNKEDGGTRKFILVTNNENNICEEVTYERLRRVNLPEFGNYKEGLEYVKIEHVNSDEINGRNNEHNIDFTKQIISLMHGSYHMVEDNEDWFATKKCAVLINWKKRDEFFSKFNGYEHIALLSHRPRKFSDFIEEGIRNGFCSDKIHHFTRDYVEDMKNILEHQEIKDQQNLQRILKEQEL